jgi:hypothetical protein
MYEPHESFPQPPDESVKVWRFMNFTKFVDLLHSRQLYFTRPDRFGDPFEGSWPKQVVDRRVTWIAGVHERFRPNNDNLAAMNQLYIKHHAVNCWHMNEHESEAMWKLYVMGNEGVAVQSTYKRLRESFTGTELVHLGIVRYLDYETEEFKANSILTPFMHKRKSFEHEKEVRAVIPTWKTYPAPVNLFNDTISHGLKVNIDLVKLVELVYIPPTAQPWFAELVKAVIDKYGFNFPVVPSKMAEQPVY